MEKLKALKLFKKYKVPFLPYEILDKSSFETQIKTFLKKYGLSKFMIRTDKNQKFTPSINNATLKDFSQIEEFFHKGYIVLIMHPGNIYKNFHSLNIMKDNNELIIEAVGPGFIATDLNRDGFAHERIVFDLPNFKTKEKIILVSLEKYKRELKEKINKYREEKIRENNGYLLKYNKYIPLNSSEMKYSKNVYPKLEKVAKDLGYKNFIASMSFLDLGRGLEPLFWDLYGLGKKN